MYSPKIREDLMEMLSEIGQIRGKPLTTLVDELLRPQVIQVYERVVGRYRHDVQLEMLELRESPAEKQVNISSPADVFRLCLDMVRLHQERLDVLVLDTKSYLTKREMVFLGSLNASVLHAREIFVHALLNRAASIIIVHNHPSGDASPSKEDIRATKEVKRAGDIIGIPLTDHVIVGRSYVSLKEEGML